MKVSTILTSALATLVAAAPTEKRSVDLSQLNNLNLQQSNLNYLLSINDLNFEVLAQLVNSNNLNLLGFQSLFQSNTFDVQALVQLAQLQTLLELAGTGILDPFDLGGLNLGGLNLGLLNNLNSIGLQQFIQPNVVTQVQTIASQVPSLNVLGGGIAGLAGAPAPPAQAISGAPPVAGVSSAQAGGDIVTDAQQNAQEGVVQVNSA